MESLNNGCRPYMEIVMPLEWYGDWLCRAQKMHKRDMTLTFHGAARTVTGSKHVLTTDEGKHILLDCGMFQGMGPQTDKLNQEWGFEPAGISCLLLSHAHIDHTGLIPKLVKDGFTGRIYATQATRDLTEILLYDSAEIQAYEERRPGNHASQALYSVEDVHASLELFEVVEYDKEFSPISGIRVRYTNAGHLPGSACIHIRAKSKGREIGICFSGDVGRYRSVLLTPPAEFPPSDYIIMESTYGDKTHELSQSTIDPLLEWIRKTCIERKGKLVIPAFSVGRTQEVLFALNQLELEKRLPELNYYVDSPLSLKATSVIRQHMESFNDRLQNILQTDDDPFQFKGLKYVETVEDSRTLAELEEPCVIISASGTADAGRVRHHIYSTVKNNSNAILLVGYCQKQSLGGQLLDGVDEVELFGESCTVAAAVGKLGSMSAHGDSDDLLRWIGCQDPEQVKGIFLVHGEYAVQQEFSERLQRRLFSNVTIPTQGHEHPLD